MKLILLSFDVLSRQRLFGSGYGSWEFLAMSYTGALVDLQGGLGLTKSRFKSNREFNDSQTFILLGWVTQQHTKQNF